jgi:hypothetical protein
VGVRRAAFTALVRLLWRAIFSGNELGAGAGSGFGTLVFKIVSSGKKFNSPTYILVAHDLVLTT